MDKTKKVKMVQFSFTLPRELREKMNSHKEVNWAGFFRKEAIKEVNKKER